MSCNTCRKMGQEGFTKTWLLGRRTELSFTRVIASAPIRRSLLACACLSVLALAGSSATGSTVHQQGSSLPARLPVSTGKTFVVSPTGNDSGPGTLARPWRTIQQGVRRLRAGERLLVRRGTYNENVQLDRAGTPDKPITIASYPGERVVISHSSYPLEIEGSYLRIRGFVLEGAKGTSSTNVYFERGAHHVELVGNEVRFSQDQGVFAEEETHHIHIIGNRIHGNGRGHVAGQHQSHGIYLQGSDQFVANNVIYDHPYGFGIQVYDQNSRSVIVQNTIVGSGHSGIVVGGSGGVDHITIRNNVIAFNKSYGVQTDSDCPTGPVVIDTNVIYGNRYGAVQRDCDKLVLTGGNILADPRFVARQAQNFQLSRRSPAVDRARADHALRVDVRNARRPAGRGYDVGAFELPAR